MHLAEIITSVIHAAGNLDVDGDQWLATPGNVAIVLPNDDIALFDDEDGKGFTKAICYSSHAAGKLSRAPRNAFGVCFAITAQK